MFKDSVLSKLDYVKFANRNILRAIQFLECIDKGNKAVDKALKNLCQTKEELSHEINLLEV
ncbi:MAG: hypothetical protein KGJ87_05235 [Planctomycetota bacterium]|nr:hypothetical protein [Planctomycetota bacterium]